MKLLKSMGSTPLREDINAAKHLSVNPACYVVGEIGALSFFVMEFNL